MSAQTPPRVTVITVSQGHGRHLERAICSVLDQGCPDLEYFVVETGELADSFEILELYENDLTGWAHDPGLSAPEALNRALGRATGEIVAFVPGDGLLMPEALRRAAERMSETDGPRWLVGQGVRVGPRDQMIGALPASGPRDIPSFLMHDSGVLPLATSFFRRELLEKYGPFDEELPLAFDYEYACRLLVGGAAPEVVSQTLSAVREPGHEGAARLLRRGAQLIAAARRHADALPLAQRYALWVNCDERERIYALAEAEAHAGHARRRLWPELLRHPWWIGDDTIRRVLMHGVPAAPRHARPAA